MQLIDAAHEREIGLQALPAAGNTPMRETAPAARLARNGKGVLRIDHRFALASSIRPSATAKKSFSIASCPIFACRSFRLGPSAAALLGGGREYVAGALEELRLPLRDLLGVDIEALRKLRERLVALDGGQRHLRFECR